MTVKTISTRVPSVFMSKQIEANAAGHSARKQAAKNPLKITKAYRPLLSDTPIHTSIFIAHSRADGIVKSRMPSTAKRGADTPRQLQVSRVRRPVGESPDKEKQKYLDASNPGNIRGWPGEQLTIPSLERVRCRDVAPGIDKTRWPPRT